MVALAACGGSSTPSSSSDAATDAPTDDSLPADGATLPVPQILVPSSLGAVRDFAVTATDIYPIVNIAGKLQLVRCPIAGCSATPQIIGQAATTLFGRGVVIAGGAIYWLATDRRIMRANLDGTLPTTRYEFLEGQIEQPLRATGGVVYFNYQPPDFHTVVMAMTATGTSAPQPLAGTQSSTAGFAQELDVVGGKVAYWHDIQGLEPQPLDLYDLATGDVTNVAASIDMTELRIATSGIAWVETTTSKSDVRACLFGTTCNTPAAGPTTFVALAAYADRVYFSGRTADNTATIVTCSIQDLAANTCTPQPIARPTGVLDLLNTRVIHAASDAVYVGTDPQGAGSLWRIPL